MPPNRKVGGACAPPAPPVPPPMGGRGSHFKLDPPERLNPATGLRLLTKRTDFLLNLTDNFFLCGHYTKPCNILSNLSINYVIAMLLCCVLVVSSRSRGNDHFSTSKLAVDWNSYSGSVTHNTLAVYVVRPVLCHCCKFLQSSVYVQYVSIPVRMIRCKTTTNARCNYNILKRRV